MEQKDRIRSILTDEAAYDQTLTELHREQAPGVFSELGKVLGWYENPVPRFILGKIMEEIRRSREEIGVNQRVMLSAGVLALFLFSALLFALVELLHTMSLLHRNQVLTGAFWMMVSLVGSVSLLSVLLFKYHEKESTEGYDRQIREKLLRHLRLWR